MSSVGRRRLDKIEASLTPRQAVLLWLDEASRFGSMRAYVSSLQGQPTSAFPLFRLPEQVEQLVRDSVPRNRVIPTGTQAAAKLLETGKQEERIRALEIALLERKNRSE